MNKLKIIKLSLVYLLFIGIILALEWQEIISIIDKIYKEVGLNTPSYLLTILEKESSFTKNIGSNAGSKERNIERCVNYCSQVRGIYCYDLNKRFLWCKEQYETLEKIVNNLGLDINKVPFSPDFGMGYTQFQPTTWIMYPELKNKNPWNLEDSLYAAGLKLKKDKINENLKRAISKYNLDSDYFNDYKAKYEDWEYILTETIFLYDCSLNDFSCALNHIKDKFPTCIENNWSIKQKKECLKKEVALKKEQKLAKKEKELKELELTLTYLETKESTPVMLEKQRSFLGIIFDIIFRQNKVSQKSKNFVIRNNFSSITYDLQTLTSQTLKNSPETVSYKEKIYSTPKEAQTKYREIDRTKENKKKIFIRNTSKEQLENLAKQLEIYLTSINTTTVTSTVTTTAFTTSTITTTTTIFQNQEKFPIAGSKTIIIPSRKDPCENYKNKSYPNVLINEVLFETENNPQDEFIELYNPTDQEIDLTCWRLEKYAERRSSTSTPTLIELIPESKFKNIKIKPFGFLLISHPNSSVVNISDLTYAQSYSISKNNTLILRKPNGEISDLLGFGDNKENIYQFETEPFVFENFQNKSIQRKNFKDTDNNSEDFWLRNPNPQNSSFSEKPREDFFELTNLEIQDFQVLVTSFEDAYFLNISFTEPLLTITSTNYSYQLLISTSSEFNAFTLKDFGISNDLPQPQFVGTTTKFSFEINKCPSTSTLYYFGLFLQDNLDSENKSKMAISSTTLPEDLCSLEEAENLVQSTTSTLATSSGLVLFSEIYIKVGTSTDEFIELYNPNDFDIDLTGWRIEKVKSTGSTSTIVSSSKLKGIIPAYSYFLLVNKNTSSNFSFEPDFIYSKSSDLAKNNALRLIDKENKIVDDVCWGNPSGFQNCAHNPQENFSLQRKKLEASTTSSLLFENYGNAYDTDNSANDFLLAQPNPENSNIENKKPTIKEIKDFKIEIEGRKYKLSWLSPALYDKDLRYELKYSFWPSTTTSIINTDLPEFHLLSSNSFELDFCSLNLESQKTSFLTFYLEILKEDEALKLASSTIEMIDCKNIVQNFELEDRLPYRLETSESYFIFKVLKDVFLKEIEVIKRFHCQPGFCKHSEDLQSLNTEIKQLISTTTELEESTTTEISIFSTSTFQKVEYGCGVGPYGVELDDYPCDNKRGPYYLKGYDIYWTYIIYTIPIHITLKQEDRIKIYFKYSQLGPYEGFEFDSGFNKLRGYEF